ncbi:MAG TPA: hypothetical protein VFM66_03365, partial [Agromyces sp.]|nr:hypothetical protein [Agromyces sp.]
MDAALSTNFSAALPNWLVDDLDAIAARPLETIEQRMSLAIELSDRNWRAGNGGPFAAIVVDAASGALVSVGVNVVLESGLSAT